MYFPMFLHVTNNGAERAPAMGFDTQGLKFTFLGLKTVALTFFDHLKGVKTGIFSNPAQTQNEKKSI